MRSGSRPSRGGTRLLFAGDTVSHIMCPAHGQQEDDKKKQTNTAKMKTDTKPKETRLDRNDVVGFRWIWICVWCFEMIWGVWYRNIHSDISWHHVIAIYRETMSRVMRYHKISHIDISYHIRFSIKLQKQWYLLESVPYKKGKLQVSICGYIDRSCVTGTRLWNMFVWRGLCVPVKPVVPALWVSPEHVWRHFFHHLVVSLTLTRTTTSHWSCDIS